MHKHRVYKGAWQSHFNYAKKVENTFKQIFALVKLCSNKESNMQIGIFWNNSMVISM